MDSGRAGMILIVGLAYGFALGWIVQQRVGAWSARVDALNSRLWEAEARLRELAPKEKVA